MKEITTIITTITMKETITIIVDNFNIRKRIQEKVLIL